MREAMQPSLWSSSNPAVGERSFDIYSRLLRERIIFLNGEVNDAVSALFAHSCCFLEAKALKNRSNSI